VSPNEGFIGIRPLIERLFRMHGEQVFGGKREERKALTHRVIIIAVGVVEGDLSFIPPENPNARPIDEVFPIRLRHHPEERFGCCSPWDSDHKSSSLTDGSLSDGEEILEDELIRLLFVSRECKVASHIERLDDRLQMRKSHERSQSMGSSVCTISK
jgi:hypothetical protein